MKIDTRPDEVKIDEDAVLDMLAELIIDSYIAKKNDQLQLVKKHPTMNVGIETSWNTN